MRGGEVANATEGVTTTEGDDGRCLIFRAFGIAQKLAHTVFG